MKVLVLTVNVIGVGPEAIERGERGLYGRFAHGRYTENVGLERLLAFLRNRRQRATFFWPAVEAARMPELISRCADDGHEIGSMGWNFENHAELDPATERELLQQAHAQLSRLSGQTPVGFRAPGFTLSATTLQILGRLGYRYDSSFLDDDTPYRLTEFGVPSMVELPYAEGLHDAHHFELRIAQPRVEMMMREALDASLTMVGWSCMSLTPRGDIGIGRSARLQMLAGVLDRAAEHGARIITAAEAVTNFDCSDA